MRRGTARRGQRAGRRAALTAAGGVAVVAELERLEDRVVGIGVAVTREDLLELKLDPRTARDHLRDRGGDRVLGLAPVLLGGIPDTTLVEL